MREFENDINNFVDNFISSVIGKIDLGTLDNIFRGLMIGGSVLLLVLTFLSLLFYKFFHKKGVRVAAYVMYSLWVVISLGVTLVILSLTYNWFNILKPIEGTIDPLIEKFRNLVGQTDTTKNFFEGFVRSIFGSSITLENLSTQSVVKFLLAIPLIICWVNLGFIVIILFSIIFGPKYEFIKITTQVVYFIIFITLVIGGVWALVLSIQTDIKVATSIETLIRTQTHIITGGIVDGLDDIKDDVNDFLDDLDDITESNINDIFDKIIKLDGDMVSIMDGKMKFSLKQIEDIFNISPDEVKDKIDELRQQFIDKGPDSAKEVIDNMKEWITNNLK